MRQDTNPRPFDPLDQAFVLNIYTSRLLNISIKAMTSFFSEQVEHIFFLKKFEVLGNPKNPLVGFNLFEIVGTFSGLRQTEPKNFLI
jgi:hypothetical protein